MDRKPAFHTVDERPVNVEGHWLQDRKDLSSIAEELLASINLDVDWVIGRTGAC